jgi:hypothetical protein
MYRVLICLLTFFGFVSELFSQSGSVGIGTTTPNPSAALDIQSTTKGVLVPRLSSVQRNAIASPAAGLLVYDVTTESFWFKSSGNWIELVDTLNNDWKRSGNHIYTANSGSVGIGKSNPVQRLSVNGAIGLYSNDETVGTLANSGGNLAVNARVGNSVSQTPALDLILQNSSGLFSTTGRVGIGTGAPDTKLHIEGGNDASAAGGGFLQLGGSAGANMAFDENEIQARSNGTAAKLFLQASGGELQIGGTNHIVINNGYQVYRNRPLSTNADLLPVAYAKVSFTGTVLSGTGNLSVQKIANGDYRLVLLGEANLYTNRNQYTILVTANETASPRFIGAEISSDNSISVKVARLAVNWSNSTCGGCTFSLLNNAAFYAYEDNDFSIVVYKM